VVCIPTQEHGNEKELDTKYVKARSNFGDLRLVMLSFK
jgi:hypothetical protein